MPPLKTLDQTKDLLPHGLFTSTLDILSLLFAVIEDCPCVVSHVVIQDHNTPSNPLLSQDINAFTPSGSDGSTAEARCRPGDK